MGGRLERKWAPRGLATFGCIRNCDSPLSAAGCNGFGAFFGLLHLRRRRLLQQVVALPPRSTSSSGFVRATPRAFPPRPPPRPVTASWLRPPPASTSRSRPHGRSPPSLAAERSKSRCCGVSAPLNECMRGRLDKTAMELRFLQGKKDVCVCVCVSVAILAQASTGAVPTLVAARPTAYPPHPPSLAP